ncbi:uncharacterized protein RHOBADRAFT_13171, partial [Rhodotorula graminis WP1]
STRIADSFVTRYYAVQDLAPLERAHAIHTLYAPGARISWNGNPIPPTSLAEFAQSMPESSHDVQAFDCHPISASGASPPSLVVTVSGQVTHGPNPTPSSAAVTNKNFDHLPRVFSQSLILTPSADPNNPGEAGYLVASDCFRFC